MLSPLQHPDHTETQTHSQRLGPLSVSALFLLYRNPSSTCFYLFIVTFNQSTQVIAAININFLTRRVNNTMYLFINNIQLLFICVFFI